MVQDGLRWKIPFHLLDAIFYYSEGKMTVNFRVRTYRQPQGPGEEQWGRLSVAEWRGSCLPVCRVVGVGVVLQDSREAVTLLEKIKQVRRSRLQQGPGSSTAGRQEVD